MLAQWAKTSPFRDEGGGLSFMTESAITRDLNLWLADTAEETALDFDLPVKRDLVKNALNNMYTDQLHCGERHGLQKSSCGSATHWSIAFDLAQRPGLHSNKFEREVQKQVFMWLEPGTDKDARAVVEALTPARSSGPKPASVVQVAFAIAGSCTSAPDVAVLLDAARLVVSGAQQRQVRILSAWCLSLLLCAHLPPTPTHPHTHTPPPPLLWQSLSSTTTAAPSSPASKPPSKQRRGENFAKSPHFSPEMEAPESDLSIHDQLLALSQQMVRLDHLPSLTLPASPTTVTSACHATHCALTCSSPIPPHSHPCRPVAWQMVGVVQYLLEVATEMSPEEMFEREHERIHQALVGQLQTTASALSSSAAEARWWRMPHLRTEINGARRLIAEELKPLTNRSCTEAVDKVGLLRKLRKQFPRWEAMHRALCTTGTERQRTDRTLSARSTPEQKMINGLIGFTQMQAVARPTLPHAELPLRLVLHSIFKADGASRSLRRDFCALRLAPDPSCCDMYEDELNAEDAAVMREVLWPGGVGEQQMVTGQRVVLQSAAGVERSAAEALRGLRGGATAAPSNASVGPTLPAAHVKRKAKAKRVLRAVNLFESDGDSVMAPPPSSSSQLDGHMLCAKGHDAMVCEKVEQELGLTCDRCEKTVPYRSTVHSCTECDFDMCAKCASSCFVVPSSSATAVSTASTAVPTSSSAASTAASTASTASTARPSSAAPPPAGTKPGNVPCITTLRAWDNANDQSRTLEKRVHDNVVQSDVTVGVMILPNAPLPPNLDTHVPEYLHVARREALSRRRLVSKYSVPGAADAATAASLALAAAAADGWVPYARLSEVPAESYSLPPGSLAWRDADLPLDASEPARLQVAALTTKMHTQLRSYQLRVDASQGEPFVRALGSAGTLMTGEALAGALKALDVEPYEVKSVHVVDPSEMGKLRVHLERGEVVPWDSARWPRCSAALGPDAWCGRDALGDCAEKIDGANASAGAVVLALTSEKEPPMATLHGGMGANAELRSTKRRVGKLEVMPFEPQHSWKMPRASLDRVRAVCTDFPEVARKAITAALPTVFANSCSNVGMAQVIAADVRICGLPYAKIFDVRRSGHDGGTQIFGGDQVTLRGIESVRTALATSITALRSQLDGLDEDDPRYWQVPPPCAPCPPPPHRCC